MKEASPVSAEVAEHIVTTAAAALGSGAMGEDGSDVGKAIEKLTGFPEETVELIISNVVLAVQAHPDLGVEGNAFHALILGLAIGRELS